MTGPLLGGNLCLLAASVGTPDLPDLTGAVLLVEEVGEPPYKVDRMLLHLRRAGVLDGVGRGGGRASSPDAPTTGRRPSWTCSSSTWARWAYPSWADCRSATGATSSRCRSAFRPPWTLPPAR